MADAMLPVVADVQGTGSNLKGENIPVHVTSIRLNKDNYLSWSAALEIGITSRGRLQYITGEKPAPAKNDPQWATWTLEDSHVKVWLISSVSVDIQPLILHKSTAYEMWTILARMYGRKKCVLHTYQIKRSIYALRQGESSVATFYAALKTKWEELDYHTNDDWKNASDQALYWEKEWMDRTFIFLGGLRNEFESVRSQLLNCDEIPGIEEVYARVEAEEQRRQIMHIDSSHGSSPTAFVSRTAVSEERDSQMEGSSVVEQSRDHLFGQVYCRKEKNVMEVVDVTNHNLARTPDDPSPMNEDLPIALRKGTRCLHLLPFHLILRVF
ncbi:hypothetical protein EJ110_NYTH36558 [Nymphaea thermarum]|nr:hypothetical protein EJ110_NYTH36558 [Nymphaea thermarum]